MFHPSDEAGERGIVATPIEGSPTDEVVRAVSVYANTEPETLPPLNRVIDPDALDDIFGPRPNGTARRGGKLEFHYAGYIIRITGDREVRVQPTSPGD